MFHYPVFAFDRDKVSARSAFKRARKAEAGYATRLRKIARHVGDIITGFDIDDPRYVDLISVALGRYAEVIEPWATSVAGRMIAEVAARDRDAWRRVSAEMGRALHKEIDSAPTGQLMRQMLAEQVGLIKSLPIEAAERVHDLTLSGIAKGARAADLVAEIMRSGEVTKSRANMIARTETSRTSSLLTQARAMHVGSTSYIWRTSEDSDVRPTHRALNGKVIRWDDPPECDPGYRAHAGAIFNCRCYPEVILPD